MTSSTPYTTSMSAQREENLWAHLPPLHTIKPEELIRYQIVDWDYNNPKHPRYLAGCVLVKSLFRRDYYYWISCSNRPQEKSEEVLPKICFNSPTSSSAPTSSSTDSNTSSQSQSENQYPTVTSSLSTNENQGPNSSLSPDATMKYNHPSAPQSKGSLPPTHPSDSNTCSLNLPSAAPSTSSSSPSSKPKRVLLAKEQEGRNIRRYGKAAGTLDVVSKSQ